MKKLFLGTLRKGEKITAVCGGTFQDVPGGGQTRNPDCSLFYVAPSDQTIAVIADETRGGAVVFESEWREYDFITADERAICAAYGATIQLQYPYRSGMAAIVKKLHEK